MHRNRKGLKRERDEGETELSFISSAVSELRWALHMCDNKCRKEGFKCHQLAAIVRRRSSSYDEFVQAVLQCDAAETR